MKKRIMLFSVLVAVLGASVLQAQTTITQTKSYTGIPGYDVPLTFNQFNPALGTLTKIEIQFDLDTFGGYLIVDNDGVSSASVDVELGSIVSLTSSDVGLFNDAPIPGLIGNNVKVYTGNHFDLDANTGDGSGDYDPDPPDGARHDGGVDVNSTSDNVGSAWWVGYQGTGTYVITVDANAHIEFGGVGGVEGAFNSPTVGSQVTVIYIYTPYESDLRLTKSVDSNSPDVGDNVTFTITVYNDGPAAAAGVTVRDVLPAGDLTYVSDNGGGTYISGTGIWTIGDLANGANTSLEITARVDDTGSIENIAQVWTCDYDDTDSTPGNSVPSEDDQDNEILTVPAQVDLELDKSVDDATPDYGDNIVFTLTVTNRSTYDNATGVTVEDVLPAGLNYVSQSGDGSYNDGTDTWTIGTVNKNNGSASIDITVSVDATGTFDNFAQVETCTEDDVDSTPGNGSSPPSEDDEDEVTVTVAEAADIQVTKTVNNSYPDVGTNVIFTITVTNNGPDDATGVTINDDLPTGLSYVSDDGGGDYDDGTGIWDIGDLANGASVSLHITVQVNSTDLITNIASVNTSDQYDPDPGNNSDDDDVDAPDIVDLELDKSVDDSTPNYGDNIVFTLTVTNTSTYDNATGVEIEDVLPTGLTYVSSTGDGTYNSGTNIWTPGTVNANNGSRTIDITVSVDATGSFENFTEVTACNENDTDSTPDNGDVGEDDDDKVTVTVSEAADLWLEKSADEDTVDLNNNVTFTITLHNDGPDNATNVAVEDILPAGFTYQSDNSGGDYVNGTGIWTVGTLNSGANTSIQIVAKGTSTGTYNNIAQVNASDLYDPDSTPDNDTPSEDDQDNAQVTVPETVDLSLTKTVNNYTPNMGDNVTFTITVNNAGPDPASGVEVEDILPAGLNYVTDNGVGSFDSGTGIWDIGNLGVGANTSLEITAEVTATGSITNTAQVEDCDDNDTDSTPGNDILTEDDQDTTALTVPPAADLELTKDVDDSTPNLNEYINFTITVTNKGPNNATNVSVEDALPGNVNYDSATPSAGSYNNSTGIWTIGTINNGISETLQIRAQVISTSSGENRAWVETSDQYDPDSSPGDYTPSEDDQDNANVNPHEAADLRLEKLVNNPTPDYKDNVIFTITVTNDGPDNATNVEVEDILPSSLNYVSDNSGGDYNDASGIWSVGSIPSGGGSASIQITATVNGTGSINNIAQVHASDQYDTDSTPDNNVPSEDDQDNAGITVSQAADLRLQKTANPTTLRNGDDITFTITVTNDGPNNTANVTVEDILPANVNYKSHTVSDPTDTYNSGSGIWTIGNLANGASTSLQITASVDITGNLDNSARVMTSTLYDPDSNPGNNVPSEDDQDNATFTSAEAADLWLEKVVDNHTPNYGDTVEFTITIHNNGPDEATNVKVEDILPFSDLTYVSNNCAQGSYGFGIWNVGSLSMGGSTSMQLRSKVTNTGTIINTAQVYASDQFDKDSTPDNDILFEDDQDTASVHVPPVVDLELEKNVNNSTPKYKSTITFTLTVTNQSTFDNATGVQVKDVIPSGLYYLSSSGDGTYNPSTSIWNIGTVAQNGGSATIDINTRVNTTEKVENITEVFTCNEYDIDSTPDNGDPGEDDYAKVSINSGNAADLRLDKTVDSNNPVFGDTITYTIKVVNDGPDETSYVKVKDILPESLEYVSSQGDGSYNNTTGIWNIGTMLFHQFMEIKIDAIVKGTGTITNTAQVSSSSAYDPDSTPNNNKPNEDDQDSEDITVPPLVDLELDKSVENQAYSYKDIFSYKLEVTNVLPYDNATNVTVEDILPEGLMYISSKGDGSYNSDTGIWNIGTVLKGGRSYQMEIRVRVDSTGLFTNKAQVKNCTETDIDSEPDNGYLGEDDDDQVSITISDAADLELDKSVNKDQQFVLEDVEFTLIVTNKGPNNATGVEVEDVLPKGCIFKADSGDGSYNSFTGVWNIGELARNEQKILVITATLDDTIGTYENVAQVKAADQYDHDSTPDNDKPEEDDQDSAEVTSLPRADLSLQKSVNKETININDEVEFTITVRNDGPIDAKGVKVKDLLPDGLLYIDHKGDGYSPLSGIWDIGELLENNEKTLIITAEVKEADTIVNIAQVSASDYDDPDSTPNNDVPEEDDQDSAQVKVIAGLIGDTVWHDKDGDGNQNNDEKGLPNVIVLLKQNGTTIATETTDKDGHYFFNNLSSGEFIVDVKESSLPSGTKLTTNNEPLTVMLSSGQIYEDADFGYKSGGGIIGDEVWYDSDGDGIRDAGETGGIDKVKINLKSTNGFLLSSIETDSSGIYYFTELPPDTYLVEIDRTTLPAGYSMTTEFEKYEIALSLDEVFSTADFGFRYLEDNVGSIGDLVWKDTDRDGKHDADENKGLFGIEVTLLDGSGNIIDRDTTDHDGTYLFHGLEAGNYIVDVNSNDDDMPDNYFLTTDNDPLYISLDAGENYSTADFGFMELDQYVGVIGDYTWHDKNWNSNQDRGEESLSYIDVYLYRDGELVDSMKTDIYGYYLFSNLPPGVYKVRASRKGPYPPNMSAVKGSMSKIVEPKKWEMTTIDSFNVQLEGQHVFRDADFGFAYPEQNWGAGEEKIMARFQPWFAGVENDSPYRYWSEHCYGGYADTSLFERYDSYDPDLLEYQILAAWACGIDGFVVDWYGEESFENQPVKLLLDIADNLYQKYQGAGMDFQIVLSYNENSIGRLDSNFIYIADSLMIHSAYWGTRNELRRPLFIYNTEADEISAGEYRCCADTTLPHDVYLLWNNPDTAVFRPMDVIYPWVQPLDNEWDEQGMRWGEDYLDYTYLTENTCSDPGDLIFALGGVWPGFDDRDWVQGQDRWMQRQDTLVYQETWNKIFDYLDKKELNPDYYLSMPWCFIESWNDLNQATQIEPSVDWEYTFNILTRENARRFKKSVNTDEVGVNNLGLLVPQHIHQARISSTLRPDEAEGTITLVNEALQSFFSRDQLKAISYADIASGLAIKSFSADTTESGILHLVWKAAEHATAYLFYYAQDSSCFEACASVKPNVVPIGKVTEYIPTELEQGKSYYIAVTAVDTNLGLYANEGWYENTVTNVEILSIGKEKTTGVIGVENSSPVDFKLLQNYPNPFNPETEIKYMLPQSQHVVLKIFDIKGREVMTLLDENQVKGTHTVTFKGENLSSGIYFYKLITENNHSTRRMILVK